MCVCVVVWANPYTPQGRNEEKSAAHHRKVKITVFAKTTHTQIDGQPEEQNFRKRVSTKFPLEVVGGHHQLARFAHFYLEISADTLTRNEPCEALPVW